MADDETSEADARQRDGEALAYKLMDAAALAATARAIERWADDDEPDPEGPTFTNWWAYREANPPR